MKQVAELLRWAESTLSLGQREVSAPDDVKNEINLEAQLLLSYVLNKGRSWLFAWPEKEISYQEITLYQKLINQRTTGQPIAYLTGQKGFWSLDLKIDNSTLIPRPETELIVEKALSLISAESPAKILDLGTGSGAIALALAVENPNWQITACDLSHEALSLAEKNARNHKLHNVHFIQSDWFSNIEGNFDLIVSNPPYIAADDPHLQQGDLRFEPITALASGAEGFDDIKSICKHSQPYLKPEAWLLFEHGYQQGEASRKILRQHHFQRVFTDQDLAKQDRVSGGQLIKPL